MQKRSLYDLTKVRCAYFTMVGPYYTLGLTRNRPIRRRSMAGSTLTLIFGLDRICAHL